MQDRWVCLLVNHTFLRRGEEVVQREIHKLLGSDFIDLSIVSDTNAEDVYGFLKCENYESHVERLARSSVVVSILPNYDNPHLLTDKEVQDFIKSARPPVSERDFIIGDVVKILSGNFSGLTGIIATVCGKGHYNVVFKFYLRNICIEIPGEQLEFCGNVFSHIKSPVLDGDGSRVRIGGVLVDVNRVEERIGRIADECKQYWQRNRES